VPIFEAIKKLMAPYEKGHVRMLGEKAGQVVLISDKEVVIAGRKKRGIMVCVGLGPKGGMWGFILYAGSI